MTQFANTPGIPKEDEDKLFAAGVSSLATRLFLPPMCALTVFRPRILSYCTTKPSAVSWWNGTMSATGCFVKPNALSP